MNGECQLFKRSQLPQLDYKDLAVAAKEKKIPRVTRAADVIVPANMLNNKEAKMYPMGIRGVKSWFGEETLFLTEEQGFPLTVVSLTKLKVLKILK